MPIQVEVLEIPAVILLNPVRHADDRGFFSEVFRADELAAAGLRAPFVQDNHVYSVQPGVLRGLHFQVNPSAQGKLVRCPRGAILDVAVDIRHGSPTFGQHVSAEISAANWRQIWVPPGFAHGYVTLTADTEVIYRVTSYYDPGCERGIAWDDPDLAIDWQVNPAGLMLSAKDKVQPRLADAPPAFTFLASSTEGDADFHEGRRGITSDRWPEEPL